MNDSNTTGTTRNIETAQHALSDAMLDIRTTVPTVSYVNPQNGQTYTTECDEWHGLYYSTATPRKLAAFAKIATPEVLARIAPLAEAVFAATAARKVVVAAEKAEKQAAREARAAKAAYKAANGARPLVLPNSNAAGNYDVLVAALAGERPGYVANYVESARRRHEADIRWNVLDLGRQLAVGKITQQQHADRTAHVSARVFSVQAATEAGEHEFDGYMAKLAGKITAKITSVESLTGRLWDGSNLVVATDEGAQCWRTQVIWNTSTLGNRFTQWPTRRA